MLQLCVQILKFLLSLPVIRREATPVNKGIEHGRFNLINSRSLEIHKILMEVRGNKENHQQPPSSVGSIKAIEKGNAS